MATFYTTNFKIDHLEADEHFNMMKITNSKLDIFGVYNSPRGDPGSIIEKVQNLVDRTKPTVVIGDFNICLLKNKNNPVTNFLNTVGFTQLVKTSTHIEVIKFKLVLSYLSMIFKGWPA